MTKPEYDTHLQPSTLEVFLDHTRAVIFIVLGMVALAALFGQSDKDLIRSILGGCATLGALAAIFVDD